MKTRSLPLGDKNIVGANMTKIRLAKGIKQKDLVAKLQTGGMDITGSGLSKIEGQTRQVTDKEVMIIAKSLGVKPGDLLKVE